MAFLTLRGASLAPVAIHAVLFDKDGTLSRSEPMLQSLGRSRVEACLGLAVAHGIDAPHRGHLQDLLERAYGLLEQGLHPAGALAVASRDHNLIATATAMAQVGIGWPDALALGDTAFRLADEAQEGGLIPACRPTEGVDDVLRRLQEAGVRCAVISNDHMEGIQGFLNGHALEDFFQALWSAEHRPCKPDPAAVHGLCRTLGVDPQRCALIGDANSDLRMARAAGVAVVIGYRAGWAQPVCLDPDFPQMDHWRELQVVG